jgi:lipopolysaccharide transport system ATP-binding protein
MHRIHGYPVMELGKRMSNDVAISVRGLSKSYTIEHGGLKSPSFREAIVEKLKHPLRRRDKETFWALKDVSFDIKKGDVVGIIGRNGAGKSTLLKILSRIVEPTGGEVDMYGRVGSLLEVGTGFHPELTGRENVYLNGAILGMRRGEIRRHFDEIVDFAEVEKFLDTPVKRYSSGMYVRLAFAVAAHLNPEILIVDEVLAVGDSQFQNKCMGKMKDVAEGGRTIVFVSHDMRAVKKLCRNGLLLSRGAIAKFGQVSEVISGYDFGNIPEAGSLPVKTHDLVVHQFSIVQGGCEVTRIEGEDSFDINVGFELLRPLTLFRMGVYIKTPSGDTLVRSFHTDWDPSGEDLQAGAYFMTLRIPDRFFMPGEYTISLHASRYGIIDYLHAFGLDRRLTISAPSDFNVGHLAERLDPSIMLKASWKVRKSNGDLSIAQASRSMLPLAPPM